MIGCSIEHIIDNNVNSHDRHLGVLWSLSGRSGASVELTQRPVAQWLPGDHAGAWRHSRLKRNMTIQWPARQRVAWSLRSMGLLLPGPEQDCARQPSKHAGGASAAGSKKCFMPGDKCNGYSFCRYS